MTLKWIRHYLRMARLVSEQSKDPSTRVGAVAVDGDNVFLSQGYNGFPRGMADSPERLVDRDFKYKYVVHAEENCIYNAAKHGKSLNGSSLFVYGLPPCCECAKAITQAGVKHVFICQPTVIKPKWIESYQDSKFLFDEVGIGVEIYNPEHIQE